MKGNQGKDLPADRFMAVFTWGLLAAGGGGLHSVFGCLEGSQYVENRVGRRDGGFAGSMPGV